MMRRASQFNPKRQLVATPLTPEHQARLLNLAKQVSYRGNPEHKRNPGDFSLNPPSLPRQGKTLCDDAAIFTLKEASELLRDGIRRGFVSKQERNGWPQNIWAVAPNGVPLEAQLENQDTGAYHGYPLQKKDPLHDEVVTRWKNR